MKDAHEEGTAAGRPTLDSIPGAVLAAAGSSDLSADT